MSNVAPARAPGSSGLTSKVTYRWQTTLPSGVRRALGLDAGDYIVYEIEGDYVLIRKRATNEGDPVVEAYLAFLAGAMQDRPDLISPLRQSDVAGLNELLAGVEVDLDEDLGDFELP